MEFPQSCQLPSSPAIQPSIADPVPYQPGSITRDWHQPNTQGIARRSAIVGRLRDAGRLPMSSAPSSLIGVAAEVLHETLGVVD